MKIYLALIVLTFSIPFSSGCASKPLPLEVRTLNIPDKKSWEPFGIAEKDGAIYVSDGLNGRILRCSGSSGFEVFAEGFDTPSHIVFDSDGNLLVVDTGSHTVVLVKDSADKKVIAGRTGIAGLSEGVAKESLLNGPIGITVDGSRILVSDTYNDRIVEIVGGNLKTLIGSGRGYTDGSRGEAKVDTPSGLLMLSDGSLLIADTGNGSIRKMKPDGSVSTLGDRNSNKIKDGKLEVASFEEPVAFAQNAIGEILVLDGDSIRKIAKTEPFAVSTLNQSKAGFRDGPISESRFSRPSGIAVTSNGHVIIADSGNELIRAYGMEFGRTITVDDFHASIPTADEFRKAGPARWPFDPPLTPRDIAGTLGELRGEVGESGKWRSFHNGLDIAGSYGEKTFLVRDEKVLDIISTRFFGSNRELVRFPKIGYIHLRIGRDSDERPFDDNRFLFEFGEVDKPVGLRIRRGAKFSAGEAIGTLNSQNHIHLVAGRYGYEYNAISALDLPGLRDTIAPTIESVELVDSSTGLPAADPLSVPLFLINTSRIHAIMTAWDRKDLNPERRRLGIFEAGYEISSVDGKVLESEKSISFKGMPDASAVGLTYSEGSRSGASGVTTFRYIIGNNVSVDEAREGIIRISNLPFGDYNLKIYATDYFSNRAEKLIPIRIVKGS